MANHINRTRSARVTISGVCAALVAVACAPPTRATAVIPEPPPLLSPASIAMQQQAPDTFKVLFETTAGDFVVEAYRAWAPLGVDRFYNLVRHGYYDRARFYRVVPRFMVQFGLHPDSAVNRAWSSARIPDDTVVVSNRRGTVTFATAGPNTRTVQLFVNLVDNARLDASGFAPIGQVTGGMDAVDRFHAGYGEMAPVGPGPDQMKLNVLGEAYLATEFPRLDVIVRSRILVR